MSLFIFTPTGEETPEPFSVKGTPTREVVRGPEDARHGTISSIGKAKSNIGFYANKQQWFKIPDSKSWFGWDKEHKPSPSDLARSKSIEGHLVLLSDGNKWQIPIVRQFMESDSGLEFRSSLPRYHDIDDDGKWSYTDVVEQYAKLYEFGVRWWDVFFAANIESLKDDDGVAIDIENDTVTIQWAGEACYTALSTNYIMTRQLLTKLRIVDTTCEADILNAMIDLPSLNELIKKNEQLGE